MFDGKLIKGKIVVVRVDHPIAPGPLITTAVDLKTIAVSIAGKVEPLLSHPLTIPRRLQQSVDDGFVSMGRVVLEEGLNFGGCRRKPSQIERDSADQCGLVGGGCGGESSRTEPGPNKSIDGIHDFVTRVIDRGNGGNLGRDESPVSLILGPFSDPAFEQFHLSRGELLARFSGGHAQILIG